MIRFGMLVMAALAASYTPASQRTPSDVARELISADRAFGAAAARDNVVTALGRVFARDVVFPVRATASFAHGREAALAVIRGEVGNATSRLSWVPIRAGVSADGMHGFTYGYTTLTRADGSTAPGKYVAYWEREGGEWRVSVYRRIGRPAGDVSLAERPPALPPRIVAAVNDSAGRRRIAEELAETERAFSRDARGGPVIGEAFAQYGDPTAANAGGGAEFTFGPAAIGASVQEGIGPETSITWAPDETRVASSGDVGVTIGIITIRRQATEGRAAQEVRVPYFTIWRRDAQRQPWRYVAE